MLNDMTFKAGLNTLSAAIGSVFRTDALRTEIAQQEAVFLGESDTSNVLTKTQKDARNNGEPFAPDPESIKERVPSRMVNSVTHRLEGAYACYKAGDEMETVRHLIIALGSLCHYIGWTQAAHYLNEQNRVLFEMKKQPEVETTG